MIYQKNSISNVNSKKHCTTCFSPKMLQMRFLSPSFPPHLNSFLKPAPFPFTVITPCKPSIQPLTSNIGENQFNYWRTERHFSLCILLVTWQQEGFQYFHANQNFWLKYFLTVSKKLVMNWNHLFISHQPSMTTSFRLIGEVHRFPSVKPLQPFSSLSSLQHLV